MGRFELSLEAFGDLEEIADFTEETWGRKRRTTYLDAIEARLRLLAQTPLIGKLRDDLRAGLRSFPVESRVVYYVVTDYGVAVVRILHKKRDPNLHL